MYKLKLRSNEEKKDLHEHYQKIINDYDEKIKLNEDNMNMTINEVMERNRFAIEKFKDDLNNNNKQLEFYEHIIKILKIEFKSFYDKYIKTHNRSFDAKQGETKYYI